MAWTPGNSIKGAIGNTGSQGIPGTPGTAGANGVDGKTVLNGSGAPAGGTGALGDFFINTTADTIYGPKTGGGWGSPTSLIGPTGSTGPPGSDADVTAHVAAADPHTQYLTSTEGDAAYQLKDADLTAIAALAPADDSFIQRKSSVWTSRTVAQVKTDLAYTAAQVGAAATVVGTPPIFQATQTVAQTVANGAVTQVTFSTETVDSDNGHSTSTNTARYVAPAAGWYQVSGTVTTDGTTAVRVTTLLKNGVEILGASNLAIANSLGDNRVMLPTVMVQMNGTTDYISLGVYAEAACNTRVGGGRGSVLTIAFVRA